jgi:hypothetical protein
MAEQRPHLHVVGPDPVPPHRVKPKLDALGFDPRLMTPERLLTLAGDQGLWLDHDDDDLVHRLRCLGCSGQVTVLTDGHGEPYPVTGTQILMDVLRHLVTKHGVQLSGRGPAAAPQMRESGEISEKEAGKWAKKKHRLFRRN